MCRMQWQNISGHGGVQASGRMQPRESAGGQDGLAGGRGRAAGPRRGARSADASRQALVGALGIAASLTGPIASAEVLLETGSAPMLDGTPSVAAGVPLASCLRLDGAGTMKLIQVEDFGEAQAAGPAMARVHYQLGMDKVVEEVHYWRVPLARADAVGQLAELHVLVGADGGLTLSAIVAHRTDRPLASVDHGTMSLIVLDRATNASVRLGTWGEWIQGADGQMEYATLSTPVQCVSVTDFSAEVPPGSPLVQALFGDGGDQAPDLIWILSGVGMEGDFTFSTWGALNPSPTAIEEVAALADEAGWTTQEAQGPELGKCVLWGWNPPPPPPCVWTVQPAPDNPPSVMCSGSGFERTLSWNGQWSQAGVAGPSGARLSKGQAQQAFPPGLWFSRWAPGAPCLGTWQGSLVLDRVGFCGTCPCRAEVTAIPGAIVDGWLDAVAAVKASLFASISAAQKTTFTSLTVNEFFGDSGSVEIGPNGVSVESGGSSNGVLPIDDFSIAMPAPLDVELGCGAVLLVQTAFAVSGWTQLSLFADFPYDPRAGLRIRGQTKFNLKVKPVIDQSDACFVWMPQVDIWQEPGWD